MNGLDMKLAYKKHIQNQSIKESLLGASLAVFSFSLFIYADIYIYRYPSIITKARIALILLFLVYVGVIAYYLKKNPPEALFRKLYFVAFVSTFAFGDLLNIVVYTQMPELSARTIQVTMAITIGCALFAGPIRDLLEQILVINFLIFIVLIIAINGLSLNIVFEFYNFAFYTIAVGIFSHHYSKTKYEEFVSKERLKLKLIELEGEIIAKESMQEAFRHMASYDKLTGFYSRSIGLELLRDSFEKVQNDKGLLSICYMDLDNLKNINDSLGHSVGDDYIIDFSTALKRSIRSTDICIRVGGDEFILVLPNVNAVNSERIWKSVLTTIGELNSENRQPYHLSCSHGIVEYNCEAYTSIEEMIKIADEKMYNEKMSKKIESLS